VRARRRFGQHFLEPAWVAKLVNAIAPASTDRFLEIGPGRGAITEPLSARAEQLVAVEVDRDLASALMARQLVNVTIITADVLEIDLADLLRRDLGATPERQVRVVGNLPYNISSPILFRLLNAAASTGAISDATLMLQEEVADRLLASPGTGEYGVLTVQTGLGADVSRALSLPPGAFRPMPKVRSAVVTLRFRPPTVAIPDRALVVELVRSVFTQRRKTLANALASFAALRGQDPKAALTRAAIDPRRRPETLQLVEFARLADVFSSSDRLSVL